MGASFTVFLKLCHLWVFSLANIDRTFITCLILECNSCCIVFIAIGKMNNLVCKWEKLPLRRLLLSVTRLEDYGAMLQTQTYSKPKVCSLSHEPLSSPHIHRLPTSTQNVSQSNGWQSTCLLPCSPVRSFQMLLCWCLRGTDLTLLELFTSVTPTWQKGSFSLLNSSTWQSEEHIVEISPIFIE